MWVLLGPIQPYATLEGPLKGHQYLPRGHDGVVLGCMRPQVDATAISAQPKYEYCRSLDSNEYHVEVSLRYMIL